ncbi:hypothetical protein HDF09_002671 [Edaphobacter lichenicola]|uniref:Uncharacterized protein n=1 Tax=Tunturiibacter empetritectus TaxID=3069691 RepID=A0A7W8IKF8_9BACT|nr:hypothetical protein [Edaphobacter lichenicola]
MTKAQAIREQGAHDGNVDFSSRRPDRYLILAYIRAILCRMRKM